VIEQDKCIVVFLRKPPDNIIEFYDLEFHLFQPGEESPPDRAEVRLHVRDNATCKLQS
jgi:hypothetical protein